AHGLAIANPERSVPIVQHADQHLLVIAAQAADLPRFGFLQLDQQLDHLPAVLAAVDIVAKKHKSRVAAAAMAVAVLQQARELVVAAMDVPDRVDQWARHADSVHAGISAIVLDECRVKQFCTFLCSPLCLPWWHFASPPRFPCTVPWMAHTLSAVDPGRCCIRE